MGEYWVDEGVRHLCVLDRKAGVFKMQSGEWVSPATVEGVLEQHPAVRQALVTGSSSETALTAFVVLRPGFAAHPLARELRTWCAHHRVKRTTIPQRYAFDTEPWTPDNGLLTATLKKRRGAIAARLATMAATAEVAAGAPDDQREAPEAVAADLAAVLPPPSDASLTLTELGVDSLTALRLREALRCKGLDVPVVALYDYSYAHVNGLLAPQCDALYRRAEIAGASADEDWDRERALPPSLARARPDAALPRDNRRDVLLTGATGFLGPVLLVDILKRVDCRAIVFCAVRGDNGRERLMKDLQRTGLPLEAAWESRIRVVRIDMSQANLGFAAADLAAMSQSVGQVQHCLGRSWGLQGSRVEWVGRVTYGDGWGCRMFHRSVGRSL